MRAEGRKGENKDISKEMVGSRMERRQTKKKDGWASEGEGVQKGEKEQYARVFSLVNDLQRYDALTIPCKERGQNGEEEQGEARKERRKERYEETEADRERKGVDGINGRKLA